MGFASIDELDPPSQERPISPTGALPPRSTSSLTLEKPLLLEGEAGVGKTEAAKAMASALGAP